MIAYIFDSIVYLHPWSLVGALLEMPAFVFQILATVCGLCCALFGLLYYFKESSSNNLKVVFWSGLFFLILMTLYGIVRFGAIIVSQLWGISSGYVDVNAIIYNVFIDIFFVLFCVIPTVLGGLLTVLSWMTARNKGETPALSDFKKLSNKK